MTDEELVNKIIKEKLNSWIAKITEWGGMLSEDEKKELFEKGGIL